MDKIINKIIEKFHNNSMNIDLKPIINSLINQIKESLQTYYIILLVILLLILLLLLSMNIIIINYILNILNLLQYIKDTH